MNNKPEDLTDEEYAETLLPGYNAGVREGMSLCSGIFHDEVERMRKSVDDVTGIFMQEAFTSTKHKDIVSELETVYYALSALSERFEDSFFEKMDSLKEPEVYSFD
jgi:hypothetical protein